MTTQIFDKNTLVRSKTTENFLDGQRVTLNVVYF